MKKFVALLLIALLMTTCGCKKDTEIVDVLASSGTTVADVPVGDASAPIGESDAPSGEAAPVDAAAAPQTGYRLVDSVAYVFEGAEGPTLYGAIEYENTGNSALNVVSAAFTFSVGGASVSKTFTPMLQEHDAVNAGQTSYLALWAPDSSLTVGAAAEITGVQLTVEAAAAPRRGITVADIYLADNYPGFSTLSGTIKNAAASTVNFSVIYTGFHDEAGKLLGVWYFTKNVSLEPGYEKPFVVQMTELPIPNLAELAASSDGLGFGFD